MSIDTIKTIATGLLSVPSRPVHFEDLLASSLVSAIAFYSAMRPLLLVTTVTATPTIGTDEQGAYSQFATVLLSSGIMYARKITVNGEQYQFRIVSATATTASVRVYATLTGSSVLSIWRPDAHAITAITWPAHHEAIIAMLCASFYLNSYSLVNADYQYSEMLQAVAASYFGRAQATLQQELSTSD